MFLNKPTRPVALLATAIAIGAGAYGIVSATAGNRSETTTATSPATTAGQPRRGSRVSNARSGPAAGGSVGTVDSAPDVELHPADLSGSEGDHQRGVVDQIPQGDKDKLDLGECHCKGRKRPCTWDHQRNNDHSQPGHPATDRRRRICEFLDGRGGPLQARRTVNVKAGRSDPSELQSGVGDDRQRNDSQQSNGSRFGRVPRRHRRPCRQAEQRRVRGPQHRCQLAAPHLRQQRLQGGRRRLAADEAPRHETTVNGQARRAEG